MVCVDTLADFLTQLQAQTYDLVLADYYLPGFTAMDAWAAARHLPQCPPFVLLSGAIGETAAVEAIRQGIADYLLKDNMAGDRRVKVHLGEGWHVARAMLPVQEKRAVMRARGR